MFLLTFAFCSITKKSEAVWPYGSKKFQQNKKIEIFKLYYEKKKRKSIFVVAAALLIKAKQQHEINQNKNTGFLINCMDFVVVGTKINISSFFYRMLGP
jgi:hypothetical protein